MKKTIHVDIPKCIDLWNELPEYERDKIADKMISEAEQKNRMYGSTDITNVQCALWAFEATYRREVQTMLEEALRAYDTATVNMQTWRKAGSQFIAEFWVNDMSKIDDPSQVNWHGQNVSKWLYAGCILVQDGRISTHH